MKTFNSYPELATANIESCLPLKENISTESINTVHEPELGRSLQVRPQVIGSKSFNNFAELMTASSQDVVDN